MAGCDCRAGMLIASVTIRNMYGEPLPPQFFEISPQDVAQADCVIIMGTSLAVKPFSEIITFLELRCVKAHVDISTRRFAPESGSTCSSVADEYDGRCQGCGFAHWAGWFQVCMHLYLRFDLQRCFRMGHLFPETTATLPCWASSKKPFRSFAA